MSFELCHNLYEPHLGTWMAPDPMAEKYPGLSPFVYCAGDPVNVVDPDGRYFLTKEDANTASKFSYQASNKADRLQNRAQRILHRKNKTIEDYNRAHELVARATELRNTLQDISAMEEDQSRAYHFEEYNTKNGLITPETRFTGNDAKGKPVVTMFAESIGGNIIHEIRHGGQFARGEIREDNIIDVEISAYRAQFAWMGVLEYPSGKLCPYPLDGTAIVGLWQNGIPKQKVKSIGEISKNMIEDIVVLDGVELKYLYR